MPGPGMVGSDFLLSPAGRWGLGKESERDVLKRFTSHMDIALYDYHKTA